MAGGPGGGCDVFDCLRCRLLNRMATCRGPDHRRRAPEAGVSQSRDVRYPGAAWIAGSPRLTRRERTGTVNESRWVVPAVLGVWLLAATAVGAAGLLVDLVPPWPQVILVGLTLLSLAFLWSDGPVRRWAGRVDTRLFVAFHNHTIYWRLFPCLIWARAVAVRVRRDRWLG